MITYIFAIDKYNKIIKYDDGTIQSVCDMFEHMKNMGWTLKYRDWEREDQRLAIKKLAHIFHARNFLFYERRLKKHGEM